MDLYSENYCNVSGITVCIVSEADENTADYINERIDAFFLWFYEMVTHSNPLYKNHIGSRIQPKERITKIQIQKQFKNYLLPGGNQYRKVSIQVIGTRENPKSRPNIGNSSKGTSGSDPNIRMGTKRKFIKYPTPRMTGGYELYQWHEGVDSTSNTNDNGDNDSTDNNNNNNNSYYISDISKFKSQSACFENLEHIDDNDNEMH